MSNPGEIAISASEVLLIVQRHLLENNEENLEVISHELKPFSATTQGFLSNHRYLCIVLKQKVKDRVIGHQLKFFAKLAPVHSAAFLKYVDDLNVFEKESNNYHWLIPRLENINIGTVFAPKCYLARNDILIFEDLTDSQYRLGNSAGGILDYEHLKLALRTLACMHSASIVLESRTGKSIEEQYPKCTQENCYPEDPNRLRHTFYQLGVETLSAFIPLMPEYMDSPDICKITDRFNELMQKIFSFVRTSTKYRNVFCHGDVYANNLMFRYEESSDQGSVPIDCKLIDYQFCRYAPPALDALCALCNSTTRLFRQNNLNSLLDDYYAVLGSFLANHNINIEDEFPREEFEETAEYFKLAALMESCFFSHISLLPEEIANGICNNSDNFQLFFSDDRISMCVKAFENDSNYRERIRDTLSDIIDNYILNEN